MRIRSEYKVREMAGEHVVIMQGRQGADMTRIISLNDSALYLWEALQGRDFTASDAAELLTARYVIDGPTALRDAEAWCDRLRENGLIG